MYDMDIGRKALVRQIEHITLPLSNSHNNNMTIILNSITREMGILHIIIQTN